MDGIVLRFNEHRGFGFIRPLIGQKHIPDLFFHVSALVSMKTAPVGARVSFKLIDGAKGPQAADIEIRELSGSVLWPGSEDSPSPSTVPSNG